MTTEPVPVEGSSDVRMRGFARRHTLTDALNWLDDQLAPLASQAVGLDAAMGRVLGQDIHSEVAVPGFARSMMDGFAVRAADTQGASAYNRLELAIVGRAGPAEAFSGQVGPGQAVRIATGAPMPEGADAVLPVEQVEADQEHLAAQGEVSPGKHVGQPGEDVTAGTVVFERGRRLRPQDLGVLSSIGVSQVQAVRQPQVRLLVTGNELLPAGSMPSGYQIADANGPMLGGLVARDGGLVHNPGIIADKQELILAALRDDVDVVLVSGGSSVGPEDHAPVLLARHGELAIHGVAMRPSSPAGMGRLDNRLVFLLPGNPVSCLCAYDFFAGRAIRVLAGRRADWPYRMIYCSLARKLVSVVGRIDYARVAIRDGQAEPLAISGASILSSTTRSDGFVVVSADSEGYPVGAEVKVYLYD